ncbi:hypothetical protein K438DRAFT_1807620 [Mycena galopus ATCC 62051]|nr:hypothetical protein K438DRAFT_1807620 [Mycena galopus ATCC 62051]
MSLCSMRMIIVVRRAASHHPRKASATAPTFWKVYSWLDGDLYLHLVGRKRVPYGFFLQTRLDRFFEVIGLAHYLGILFHWSRAIFAFKRWEDFPRRTLLHKRYLR